MPRLISIVLILVLFTGIVPMHAAEQASLSPGIAVWLVNENSPAARAGVRRDDLILACDGQPAVFISSLRLIVEKARNDGRKTITLKLKRNGKAMSLDLPVSDELGLQLRPPMTESIARKYYACLSDWPQFEAARLMKELPEAADKVEKELGDTRLAAWTWLIVYGKAPAGSPEARRAAGMYAELSSKIGDGMSEADGLKFQGDAAYHAGDLKTARGYHERALNIREKWSPDSLAVATNLNNLGVLCHDEGDLKTARGYHERALKIREKRSPDSLDVANSLSNLGLLCRDEGDLKTARGYCERALKIREKRSPDSLDVANSLNNLGVLCHDEGDLKTARGYYERALKIREKWSPDSLDVANSLYNLVAICHDEGDLKSARGYCERALKIREKWSPDSLDVANSLNNLGAVCHAEGNLKSARGYYERALKIHEKWSPDSLAVATSLNNLGMVCYDEGDLKSARGYHERALKIREKWSPDSLDVANSLSNLGLLCRAEGDLKTARGYHERALKIYEKWSPDSLAVANSLYNLGAVCHDEGDTAAALEHIERAINIAREHGGLLLLSGSLNFWGRLQRERDKDAALGSFKESVQVFESIGYTDVESRERVLSESKSRLYDDLIQLLLEMNKPDEALKYLERAKSKAVVDALNVSSIRTGNDALTALLKKYADLQASLRAQQQAIEKEKAKPEGERSLVKIEQLTKLLAQVKEDFSQVVNQIDKEYGSEYSALVQVKPIVFSAIQKQLPEGAVAVEYFPAEEKLYIFIITRDSFKVKEHAVSGDQLDGWVEQVRQSMDDWTNGLGLETPPDALTSLYDNLVAPVENDIAANKTVIFVPSGTLCYLPFAALAKKNADGKLQYLVERDKQFVTLTQMALLGNLLENEKLAAEGRTVGAIAFGNPTGIKPALPGAEKEVNAIAGIYPDSKPFIGDDATEWRVKLQAQYGRIVHLATHAMLRHDDPNESYIALMAGENEDGRLTGGEIFGLPLEGTMLVVLSACQTAVADDSPGREISSLAQAFAIAGAPTVVASLWSVNDVSTGKLMAEFYKGLGQGKSKAAALRDAQRSLLIDKEHGHPFFWASFTLLGAWE